MNKKTKWLLISIAALVVVLFVLSKLGVFGKAEGINVTTEKVQKRNIIQTVTASGKVYPEIEVKISPDVSGEITELLVSEGDTVKKGQLLGRIYADIYSTQRDQASSGVSISEAQVASAQAQAANAKANVAAMRANLDQAQKTFDMQKQLYDEKVISKNEFNIADNALKTANANYQAALEGLRGNEASIKSAQANVQSSRAALSRADKDLDRTAIIAPMDGVVSLLSVKRGERVVGSNMMAGTEILRIADMSKIEVRVDVGENDIPKVKLGDKAIITIDAYNDKKFTGVVTQIAGSSTGAAQQSSLSSTNTDVTQYKVSIRLDYDSYKDLIGKGGVFPFRPGMNTSADIQTENHQDVLGVPINAVSIRDKEQSDSSTNKIAKTESNDGTDIVVFLLGKDGKAIRKKVESGIQDINYIEILNGLKEGDEVITGPYDVVSKTLQNGTQVKKVEKGDLYKMKK